MELSDHVIVDVAGTSETGFLYHLGRIFTSSGALDALLENVLKLLKTHLGVERGMISIRDKETEDIYIDVSIGYSDKERRRGTYRLGEGITGRVIATGRPIVLPSAGRDPAFLNKTGARTAVESENMSFICMPIKREGIAIGTISVDKRRENSGDIEREINLLAAVAIMVAHAVDSRREMTARESGLEQENRLLRIKLASQAGPRSIIGSSPVVQELVDKILLVAPTNSTVLITGESGTGKELIADAIHEHGPRRAGAFVKVNLAALPDSLIESELFGHEKGAFTGALSMKKGRFELANGGTIFLDEIGDLCPHLQVKLLRVIQEKSVERLGAERSIALDVRIIAATHQNLEERIARGEFRADLFYRLNVFPLFAPPLRERRADIVLLADHFLERYAREQGKKIRRISGEAIDLLVSYHWPGNVRELENCIERAVILSDEDVIRSCHLPPSLQRAENAPLPRTLGEMTDRLHRELIIEHLKMTKGNITRAASLLGTTKRILTYRIRQLGVNFHDYS